MGKTDTAPVIDLLPLGYSKVLGKGRVPEIPIVPCPLLLPGCRAEDQGGRWCRRACGLSVERMRNRQGRTCDERSIFFFRFLSQKKRNGNLKNSKTGSLGSVVLTCVSWEGSLATFGRVLNAISNDSKDTIKEHCSTVLCPFPRGNRVYV